MSHFFLPLGKLLPKDINFYTSVQAEKSPKVILSCHQKIIKKQTDSALNFPLPPKIVWGRVPLILLPLFFKGYLNPHARINKMENSHIVNYQPSPWGLTSRVHSLLYFSPEFLLWFELKLCIFHHSWRTFSNLWGSGYRNIVKYGSRHF